jgi:integrase
MATIRRRGERWQVQIRRKAERSLSRSFRTRKDAEAWARQIEAEADRIGLPPNRRILNHTTLGGLVRRYRDEVTPRKRGGNDEHIVLTAFLRHPICDRTLSGLSPAEFATYRDERLQKVKASTVKRQLATIHNVFEVAREEWRMPLPVNPLTALNLPDTSQKRERRLRADEHAAIVLAAAACRNTYMLPIILVALETGMRRREMLSLQWDDVDLISRELVVRVAKNGHPRVLPLSLDALNILAQLPRKGSRIFPTSPNAVRLAWERLKARAGVNNLRFHDLRHEALSRLFEKGLSTPEVALISGHRDVRMLFRYTHPLRKAVLDKLDARCSRQNPPGGAPGAR